MLRSIKGNFYYKNMLFLQGGFYIFYNFPEGNALLLLCGIEQLGSLSGSWPEGRWFKSFFRNYVFDWFYCYTFYMATVFIGFHVFIGACFLSVFLIILGLKSFTRARNFVLKAAFCYWHFVDAVVVILDFFFVTNSTSWLCQE